MTGENISTPQWFILPSGFLIVSSIDCFFLSISKMADPISVAGLALTVAGAGARLSLSLFDVAHAIKSAPQEIADIAHGLSTVSAVLTQLNDTLLAKQCSNICKPELFTITYSTLQRFEEVEKQLTKITSKRTKLTRLKWFFNAPKAKVLLQKIEGIKSALTLILGVIQLAGEQIKNEYLTQFAISS